MLGICGFGILLKLVLNVIYFRLVKASTNMAQSKNKLTKLMKTKFETYYRLKIGVNNVDIFVDKYIMHHKVCGILLSTWDNLCGQVLMLCVLIGSISTILGLIYECGRTQILSTFSVGIFTSGVLIFLEGFTNISNKKERMSLNMKDYLENLLKVRLEQEIEFPELIEKYKKEYLVREGVRGDERSVEYATAIGDIDDIKKESRQSVAERQQMPNKQPLSVTKFQKKKLQRQKKDAKRHEKALKLANKKEEKENKKKEKLLAMETKKQALETKKEIKKTLLMEQKAMKEQKKQEKYKTIAQERKENLLKEVQGRRTLDSSDNNIEFIKDNVNFIDKNREYFFPLDEQIAVTKVEDNLNLLKKTILEGSNESSFVAPKERSKIKKKSLGEDKIIEDILKEFLG